MNEVEEAARAVDEACHDAAGSHGFVAVGDGARFDQVDDAIGEHLGVNPEVAFIMEAGEHGIRNAADTHLQRGSILDQIGNDFANARLNGRLRPEMVFEERSIRRNKRVDAFERQDVVPVRARHLLIDFGDDQTRSFRGGFGGITGCSQRTQSVAVGRRNLQYGDVQLNRSGEEKPGDIGEKDGDKIRAMFGDGGAQGRAGEKGHGAEFVLPARGGKGRGPRGVQMIELHVFQILSGAQGLEQRSGCRAGSVDEDVGITSDKRHDIGR